MKLLLCLSELPSEKVMSKLTDVTDRLVNIHVQFSRTRFAWELENVLSKPETFVPTLEDKFVQAYRAIISGLEGNNVVCDTRLQVLLPSIETLLEGFDLAVYLPEKSKDAWAKKAINRSGLVKVRTEKDLIAWLE
jgi:hypothetical protein